METEEFNEVSNLLHIVESVAQNHPSLQAIGRACQRRLMDIEADLRATEEEEVKRSNEAAAAKAAADYKPPKEGSPNYIPPEKPIDTEPKVETKPWTPDEPAPPVDRRV